VDRGLIRILDIAFVAKDADGSVSAMDLGELKQVSEAFAEFEGASSGLLGFQDLQEAANALELGTSAAVIVGGAARAPAGHDPAAQGPRRPQGTGHPDRGGVRGPEGQDPRQLNRRPSLPDAEADVAINRALWTIAHAEFTGPAGHRWPLPGAPGAAATSAAPGAVARRRPTSTTPSPPPSGPASDRSRTSGLRASPRRLKQDRAAASLSGGRGA
jgi:hypothetical protein